ncbi:MAG: InlB B-repeat-containing protein, partial [Spirochaetaceae bacterium]|nr:InlB B-repeat-containing protein [Spirochaetaceae bacterium]
GTGTGTGNGTGTGTGASTYTVTYDKNKAGSGTAPQGQTKLAGSSLILQGNSGNLARDGYTFNGWNTSADGTGDSYQEGAAYTKDESVTLYAKWIPEGDYTITYNLGGGTNHSDNPASYNVETPTITLRPATKTGYTFSGWHDGTHVITEIAQGTTGDISLTATWTANTYTVKFEGNGGSGSMDPQEFDYDQPQQLTANQFTLTSYEFSGWNTQVNGGGTSYTDGQSVSNLTDINGGTVTLYAQWKAIEYTITYNLGGGTNHSDNPARYTVETQPITLSPATKTGYTFNGWEKDGSPITEIAQGTTEDISLTAQWTANIYTVKFEGNGGSGSMDPQEFDYDQTQSLTNNQFTRIDHEFVGWNTVANGKGDSYENGQSVSNLTADPNGSVTLYAQWAALVSGSGGASSDAVNYIKNLANAAPGIYTVKVTGSLSSSEVPTIRDALIAAGSNVKVRLDLSSVTGLTAIPQYAFNSTNGNDGSRASNLVWIRLPDTVTSIGKCAFDCLTQLKYVDLGSGVISIEREVFDYCYALSTIRVSANPPPSWDDSNPFRLQGDDSLYAQRTVEVPSGLLSTYQGSGWASLPKATLTGY